MAEKASAIQVVNTFLESDTILSGYIAPQVLQIFPGYAPEQDDGTQIFPYIRYIHIPGFHRYTPKIRVDIVQYWIGDTDLDNVLRIQERLLSLMNSSDDEPFSGIDDPDGNYKIMGMVYRGGVPQTVPNEDEGVWEMGASFEVVYTDVRGKLLYLSYDTDALLI